MQNEPTDKFKDSNLFYRLLGLAAIFSGLALCKYFVWDVLEAAKNRETDLHTFDKAVVMVPFLVLMGLIWLWLGKRALPLFTFNRSQLTAFQIIFLLIAVCLGLSLNIWLSSELSTWGYPD